MPELTNSFSLSCALSPEVHAYMMKNTTDNACKPINANVYRYPILPNILKYNAEPVLQT